MYADSSNVDEDLDVLPGVEIGAGMADTREPSAGVPDNVRLAHFIIPGGRNICKPFYSST